MKKPKLLVILGPTASGKSDLAVELAEHFNGEVISADSRQVYSGLNKGTGKITKKEMRGIPHHLLDISNPKKQFTVANFQKEAHEIIEDIHRRHKLPILCGGTGFYIQSVVDNITLPEVPPNTELRKKLERKNIDMLLRELRKLDARRADTIDTQNKRKIIRAIEIARALGNVPEVTKEQKYSALQIGISTDDDKLKEKINNRLHARIKFGMIKEVKTLHEKGLSWKRMRELGLEYKYISLFLENKLTKKEMITNLSTEIWHYAKRQKTWFKKDTRIKWFSLKQRKEIIKVVTLFTEKKDPTLESKVD